MSLGLYICFICCVINSYELYSLKAFIITQFPWISSLGMASLETNCSGAHALQSRGRLGCILIWRPDWEELFQYLWEKSISLWLNDWGSQLLLLVGQMLPSGLRVNMMAICFFKVNGRSSSCSLAQHNLIRTVPPHHLWHSIQPNRRSEILLPLPYFIS